MTQTDQLAPDASARLKQPYHPSIDELIADQHLETALLLEVVVRGRGETAALLRGLADGLERIDG